MLDFDTIIKDGEIIDGTGEKSFFGSIAVKDGMIACISTDAGAFQEPQVRAKTIIDAGGKVIAPGFIDPHAHNDGYIFFDPSNIYKLAQGVTTEISGNCGEGLAPVSKAHYDETYEYYRPYYPGEDFRTYESGQAFYSKAEQLPLGTNIGFLCAHGTLRMYAMGFSSQKAGASQLELMKEKLAECLKAGALGMSSGLVYSPGCFADTRELTELCKVVKQYNGIYATHMRSEGYALREAVEEVIEIARASGVRAVISHLKVLGKNYWGMSREITELIESARKEGIDIFCDQYPYTNSCTVLHWVIPVEYTDGGFVRMCSRLSDPAERHHIKEMYNNKFGKWDNLMENITPQGIHILKADHTPGAVGLTLQQYADSMGADAYDTLFDVIIANKADAIAAFDCMSEEDIRFIMQRDYCMAGSDGIDVLPEEKTHPRLTGTFPRILGKYVREEGVLPLEEAIRKMTSLPASVLGLKGKGILKQGFDADICIFDKQTVRDRGTLENFNIRPRGIEAVLVNGSLAFENGTYTGAACGKRVVRV